MENKWYQYAKIHTSFSCFVLQLYADVKAFKKFKKFLFKRKAKLQSTLNYFNVEEHNEKPVLIDGILLRAENKELFIVELQKELYKRGLININIYEFEKHFKDSASTLEKKTRRPNWGPGRGIFENSYRMTGLK